MPTAKPDVVVSFLNYAYGETAAIRRREGSGMPILAPTGERLLDRIVDAINAATAQIAALKREQNELSRRVAAY